VRDAFLVGVKPVCWETQRVHEKCGEVEHVAGECMVKRKCPGTSSSEA